MIEVERISVVNIQIQNNDIEIFSNIITKLLEETKTSGFKKSFTKEEQNTIKILADALGLSTNDDDIKSSILMLKKQ